jgi:hypothetical protein
MQMRDEEDEEQEAAPAPCGGATRIVTLMRGLVGVTVRDQNALDVPFASVTRPSNC